MDILTDTKKLKPSDKVMAIYTGYENARQYWSRKLKNYTDNWRFYWAKDPELGLGQWEQQAVQYMLSQNRQLTQFNFVKVIVDTIQGGIMQQQFDPEFYPINEEITSLTQAIKKAMYSDKELMNWDAAYNQLVMDGLVHEAVIKMCIDRTFDPVGNIALKNCNDANVLRDPNWRTWNGYDMKRLWYDTWHTQKELIAMFPEQKDFIAYQYAHPEQADTYGPYTGVTTHNNSDDTWGSQLRLTTQYDMIDEVVQEAHAVMPDGEDVAIPADVEPMDRAGWLNQNYPNWSPESSYDKPKRIRNCFARSICPAISWQVPLQACPTELQIGRIPFFFWAPSMANGETSSLVDSVKDPQTIINYMESMLIFKMQSEGGGGAQFVDEKGFKDAASYQDYILNRNNPTKTFAVKPGQLSDEGKAPAQAVQKSAFPQEAYQMVQHMVNIILPHISKTTSATKGIMETGVESGKLYNMLKLQGDLQVYTIHHSLRLFWNQVYEGYLLAATDLYGREAIERTFSYNKGREKVTLNERLRDETGAVVGIRNDVSKLNEIRHKVIIGDKQASPTEKIEQLDAIGKLIQNLGGSSPLVTKYLVNKAMLLITSLDDDDREMIGILNDKDMELAVGNTEVLIMQAQLNKITLSEQIKAKLNPPQPQQQLAPPGGMSGQPVNNGAPAPAAPQAPQPEASAPVPEQAPAQPAPVQ